MSYTINIKSPRNSFDRKYLNSRGNFLFMIFFFQELIGNYIFMEEYFMRETVMKVSCTMFDLIRFSPSNAWMHSSLASCDFFTIMCIFICFYCLLSVTKFAFIENELVNATDTCTAAGICLWYIRHFYFITSYLRYFLHNVSTVSS